MNVLMNSASGISANKTLMRVELQAAKRQSHQWEVIDAKHCETLASDFVGSVAENRAIPQIIHRSAGIVHDIPAWFPPEAGRADDELSAKALQMRFTPHRDPACSIPTKHQL